MLLPKHMAYATALTRAQMKGERDYLNKVNLTNKKALEQPMRKRAWEARQKEKTNGKC